MVKMILFSPEKLKLRNISSAWLLSLIYEGSDLTMGVMTLSKWLEIRSVGQLHAETIGNFLVKSAFKFNNQPGTFTCKRTRCKTCPFISNTVKILGPNRPVKVTDHFTCISTNVIYCITCTLCKKICIGKTGRSLADRFREHLRDAEQNNTDASKPVARHFNLPYHSHHNMTICGLS